MDMIGPEAKQKKQHAELEKMRKLTLEIEKENAELAKQLVEIERRKSPMMATTTPPITEEPPEPNS